MFVVCWFGVVGLFMTLIVFVWLLRGLLGFASVVVCFVLWVLGDFD